MAKDFKVSAEVKTMILEFYRREVFFANTSFWFDVYSGGQPEATSETPIGTALGRIAFDTVVGTTEEKRIFDTPYAEGTGYRMDWKGSVAVPVTGDATLTAGTARWFRFIFEYLDGSIGLENTDGTVESVHWTGSDTIDLADATVRML